MCMLSSGRRELGGAGWRLVLANPGGRDRGRWPAPEPGLVEVASGELKGRTDRYAGDGAALECWDPKSVLLAAL